MEIRTEDHRHDDPSRTTTTTTRNEWYHKRPSKWLLAPLLLVLVGAVGAAWAEQHENRWDGASGYNDRLPRAALAYQGQVWVAEGNPVLLPDRRMVKVGETVEDLDLYTVSIPAGGGGGPAAQPLVSASQVFLRVGPDQYQPIHLRRVGNANALPLGPNLDD